MRYAFIFLLTIFFGVSNAQKSQNIKKEDVIKSFKDDIRFWRYKASVNLLNSNQTFIKLTKTVEGDWTQTKVPIKEASNLLCTKFEVPNYDTLANFIGYVSTISENSSNFITVSGNPELKNKIGFGYEALTSSGEKMYDFIIFADINNWPKLKDQRQKDFLKLLYVSLQNSKGDSMMNQRLNNKDSKMHFFDLNISDSDSLPLLHIVVNYLFKGYEKDFTSVYYSGKDSSYDNSDDQFGNSKMVASATHEYLINVYDENGNPTSQRTSPYSINMNEICLFFDKLPSIQKTRPIYPGANFPIFTGSGICLGKMNAYLSNLASKRFSQTNQTLIDYLIQIYN